MKQRICRENDRKIECKKWNLVFSEIVVFNVTPLTVNPAFTFTKFLKIIV